MSFAGLLGQQSDVDGVGDKESNVGDESVISKKLSQIKYYWSSPSDSYHDLLEEPLSCQKKPFSGILDNLSGQNEPFGNVLDNLSGQNEPECINVLDSLSGQNEPCINVLDNLSGQNYPCNSVSENLIGQNEPCSNVSENLIGQNEPCSNVLDNLSAKNKPCSNVLDNLSGHNEPCNSDMINSASRVQKLQSHLGAFENLYQTNKMMADFKEILKSCGQSFCLSENMFPKICDLVVESNSRPNFAWRLARYFLTDAQLRGRCTYGNRYKKQPLDEAIIVVIQFLVFKFFPLARESDYKGAWRRCYHAIDSVIKNLFK